ncbi:MAG: hypothetical protein JSW04_00730 [Desulfobacterales bacterium]|nr:MAG: hypothetical protein JSW04_00730 [Desulfobacterales bacterium]
MRKKIKLLFLTALLGAAGYFLLNYHFIYLGNSIKLLNKKRLTSDYTFVYASNQSVESILRIDTLREAGIGDILVEIGRISEEKKESLEKKFDSDPVYY